jgi:hypothetical protein
VNFPMWFTLGFGLLFIAVYLAETFRGKQRTANNEQRTVKWSRAALCSLRSLLFKTPHDPRTLPTTRGPANGVNTPLAKTGGVL